MNNSILSPLFTLWETNDEHLLIADNNTGVSVAELRSAVAVKQSALLAAKAKSCLIYRLDSVEFISDFLACIYSGVDVVVPPNAQAKTYQRVSAFADEILGDFSGCLENQSAPNNFEPTPHNITITLFTSGSTGQAKAVSRPLSYLLAEAHTLEKLWGKQMAEAMILASVSHQHIYGLLFKVLWPLCYGHTIWRHSVPFEENLHYLMARFSATVLVSSPAFLTRLSEKITGIDHGLRCVFSSGGALSQEQAQQAESCLNSDCIRVFGSTETGGVAYQHSQTNEWTVLPQVTVRQENGILQVSSPYCYQQPWFSTADKVRFIDDRRFVLLGRVDDVVKIEEKRIALTEVENTLCQHPWVVRAKVLVLPAKRRCLGAVLVLNEAGRTKQAGHPRVCSQTLRRFLSDYFEAVTLPRYFRYVPALPEDAQGKIARADLLALFNLSDSQDKDKR